MRLIVISVGTSLLNNNEGERNIPGVLPLLETFRQNKVDPGAISVQKNENGWKVKPENVENLMSVARDFERIYFDERNIRENINAREQGKDQLPAEISSLFLFYYNKDGNLKKNFQSDFEPDSDQEIREKDRIILLTTDTADAVYCANIIREMIKHVPLFNQKCKPDDQIAVIQNLDVYNAAKWTKTTPSENGTNLSGLNALYNYFSNLKRDIESRPGTSGIIIRTGGYKELCANLLMIGMDRGFKTYYLFEKSYDFIVVDTVTWPKSYWQVATHMIREI